MPQENKAERLASWAFYILAATVFLAPLAFLPSQYVALDSVKTAVIALGVIVSIVLCLLASIKERRVVLVPRSIQWISVLIGASLVISSFAGGHFGKSFFGQGFELGAAGFIIILFAAAGSVYASVVRRPERAIAIYAAAILPFIILFIFHVLRFIFGAGFASLSILSSVTTTVAGGWYDLAAYSLAIAIVAVSALIFLPLSRRMNAVYWALALLGAVGAYFINDWRAWAAGSLVLLGMAIYASFLNPRPEGKKPLASFLSRIAWIPVVACVIAAIFAWQGTALAGPAIGKINASYSETRLPWQLTLDVGAGAIKDHPLFGVGPNRFGQAYLDYKPAGINQTDAWNAEFSYGFGLIPTFIVTQGLVGGVLWILFLVFLGILGARALRNLPAAAHERFIVVSSYAAAVFLWLMLLISVPAHATVFYAFVFTGVFFGSAAGFGSLAPRIIAPAPGTRSCRALPIVLAVLVAIFVALGLAYAKDAAALGYFGAGVKQLTASGNSSAADADFRKALWFNSTDVYWQGRAEASIAEANAAIASVTSTSTASTTQEAALAAGTAINNAVTYARDAIAYDPTNYYNYVSEARAAAVGASVQMSGAYDTAVSAYTSAIQQNPQNPSLYLALAQFEASQNKLAAALQAVGAALQIKSNYLDAIYLLSQIEAAQGNLKDAITAAQVAIQINSQSPLLYFQLGLLEYDNQDYADAAPALSSAIKLQPDYANAQYFLGLSYAGLGQNANAIAQFEALAQAYPDNSEVSLILSNLQAGRSAFADAKPPVTAAPEKRAAPPLPQEGQ